MKHETSLRLCVSVPPWFIIRYPHQPLVIPSEGRKPRSRGTMPWTLEPRSAGIYVFAGTANFSAQRIRPVICITANSVMIAPIVTDNPVYPFKKNAYENNTR